MKQSNQIKDMPITSVLDQSWASFLSPTPRLRLNTLDFSDLWDEDDLGLDSAEEDGGASANRGTGGPEIPPAPPIPPPLPPSAPPLPPASPLGQPPGGRTLRLHWRELQSLPDLPRVTRFGNQTIWAALEPVRLDTNQLEYLFESKANSAICSMKPPAVSVLGVKRSNIVTIALNRLPPPHLLPPAIYGMDASVLDREDVQRLQALVPSEEELVLIREARAQSPRSPLAPAELCLLTLGDIPHLSSRLQLWAFTLDYDTLEREIAEPLFHLKLAMEQLSASQTFRCILATVLAIGNFLNGCKARGFELSYLGKLSQVRDTHSRRPLLHHVCVLLLQLYPQTSDLYSDIAAVTRASKCDYSQVQSSLAHLEGLCRASREQVRLLERVDEERRGGGRRGGERRGGEREEGVAAPALRRLPGFLKECEERLRVLRAVHRRVVNRFHSFLLFLGYSRVMVRDTRPEDFCKTVSDFSLEYRAARLSILQQREREGERERRGGGEGGPGTPAPSQKHPQTPDQALLQGGETGSPSGGAVCSPSGRGVCSPSGRGVCSPSGRGVQQCKLEELLRTPDPVSRLDLTLRRHRSQKTDNGGPFSQRLKW